MGEWDHCRLQMLLSRYLSNREKQWGIIVVPEQRVQVKATRYRVPDISVVTGPAPLARSSKNLLSCALKSCLATTAWRRCWSASTTTSALGFATFWLIHPRTLRAFVYTPERVMEAKDGILRTEGPDVCVPLAELE